MEDNNKKEDRLEVSLGVELVGIKNLKSTHNWRLEFDVYEEDNNVVKELFDVVDMPLTIGIVGKKRL